MKIIKSFEIKTLDGTTLFCAEMSDGTTWISIAGQQLVSSTDDDIENGGFVLADIYKRRVFETAGTPLSQDQFVGNVNSFIDY
jgi:hypothetical protein